MCIRDRHMVWCVCCKMPLALAVLEVAVSLTGCEPLPFIFSRDRYLKKESTSLCAFVFEATVPGGSGISFCSGCCFSMLDYTSSNSFKIARRTASAWLILCFLQYWSSIFLCRYRFEQSRGWFWDCRSDAPFWQPIFHLLLLANKITTLMLAKS